jgi:fatty acid-binding protein DegV
MLSIKPLVDLSSGEVEEAGKQRTRRKAMIWLRDTLAEQGAVERLCICHGDAPDLAEFKAVLGETTDLDRVLECFIGATIGTHGGPRILGLSWLQPA